MWLPWGSRRSARIVPPCRSTIQRAIARPRPAPPRVGAAHAVAAVEALEDALEILGRDARTLVVDLERHRAAARRGRRAQRDAPGPRRVAHRVLDEVHDDLVDALGVARDDAARRGASIEKTTSVGRVQSRLARGALEHVAHRERADVERLLAGLQAREVEQLRHEPAEPARLREHRAQRLGVGLADAVDDVLEHRLQRADRRAQLVGDVRDEVAAQAVGLGELGGHAVERARELADLVVGRHRHLAAVLAARHRASRRRPSRAAASSCRGRAAARMRARARSPPPRRRATAGPASARRRSSRRAVIQTAATITMPSLSFSDVSEPSGVMAAASRTRRRCPGRAPRSPRSRSSRRPPGGC